MSVDQKPSDDTSAELDEVHRQAEPKGDAEDAGEDDGSTAKEGDEDHLKPDQKTTSR